MKRYFFIFFGLYIVILLCTIFSYKITGGRFKEINPIEWEIVFSDFKNKIIVESLVGSIVAFAGLLYIERQNHK